MILILEKYIINDVVNMKMDCICFSSNKFKLIDKSKKYIYDITRKIKVKGDYFFFIFSFKRSVCTL